MIQLEASNTVQVLADEIAQGIANEKLSPFDSMLLFCKLCGALRAQDLICEWHKDFLSVPEACNVCPTP